MAITKYPSVGDNFGTKLYRARDRNTQNDNTTETRHSITGKGTLKNMSYHCQFTSGGTYLRITVDGVLVEYDFNIASTSTTEASISELKGGITSSAVLETLSHSLMAPLNINFNSSLLIETRTVGLGGTCEMAVRIIYSLVG